MLRMLRTILYPDCAMPTSNYDDRRRASRAQPHQRKTADALRYLGALALAILLAAVLLACTGENEDPATNERITALETRAHSLEQSLQVLTDENADLKTEIATLQDRLNERDAQIQRLEQAASKAQTAFPDKEQWSKDKDEWLSSDPDPAERTASMIEDAGGQVRYITHPERQNRTILALPREFVDGQTPLIVSLHGFGGNSAHQIAYVPLHERMNSDRFALLLPNGTPDADGNRSWNPTDDLFTKNSGDTPQDDVAYLTELVAEAKKIRNFGAIYFFGYSNGGFMAYHIACKGLPGLRAVASLSGTSYADDSTCEDAPPVSILHIHGTQDNVILYDGDRSQPDPKTNDAPAFYASAEEMVARWSQHARCPWPDNPQPYTTLDLDQHIPGKETQLFRPDSPCPTGITIELWKSDNSGHAPNYGETFRDALLSWLLSHN